MVDSEQDSVMHCVVDSVVDSVEDSSVDSVEESGSSSWCASSVCSRCPAGQFHVSCPNCCDECMQYAAICIGIQLLRILQHAMQPQNMARL